MNVAPEFCDHSDALAQTAELERRHDGPPPPAERLVALAGGGGRHAYLQAVAEAAFFAAMIRGQLRTIRRRRADGSFYPALLSDLALYRRQRRAWRRIALSYRRRLGREAEPRRALGGASVDGNAKRPAFDQVV
jgi:hypothetical protein